MTLVPPKPLGIAGSPRAIKALKEKGFQDALTTHSFGTPVYELVVLLNWHRFGEENKVLPLADRTMIEAVIEADRIFSDEMVAQSENGVQLANRIYLARTKQ